MLVRLLFWIRGSRTLRVPPECADTAARLLNGSGADFRRMRRNAEGLQFVLPLSECARMMRIFARHGITAETVREHGLPPLAARYRKRLGIPVGIVLFAVILIVSEQFIWSVRVVGNTGLTSARLVERLEALGVGVGTYIPSIDYVKLQNRLLIDYDDLAWAALNVNGTTATLEVRERLQTPAVPDEEVPHNLVAAEDGIIRHMEILRGVPEAEQEALVREGELLASGILEEKLGLRLVHARGSVLAEVKREVHIAVPLSETVRVPHEECVGRYLNFFGISLKLFGNTGNIPSEYDTILEEHPVRVFGVIELPLSVREEIRRSWSEEPVTRTEEEAKAEAYRRFRAECAALTDSAELISREIEAGMQDGAYVIACELRLLKDIAREVPIYTD